MHLPKLDSAKYVQIIYDNMVIHYFSKPISFIHCESSILSLNVVFPPKIVFCSVLKQKDKLIFLKYNIINRVACCILRSNNT